MTVQSDGEIPTGTNHVVVVKLDELVPRINRASRKDVIVERFTARIISCRPQLSKKEGRRLLVISHKRPGGNTMSTWCALEGDITLDESGVLRAPGQPDLKVLAFA
jgi:hypothetical protein